MNLWEIESELARLMEARETALLEGQGEQVPALDIQIVAAAQAEVMKVDGIRAIHQRLVMLRDAAQAEAEQMQRRARILDSQIKALKASVQVTMEAMPWREGRLRKLQGRTGSISLKGNGGRQPVIITDETMIPDEFTTVTAKMDCGLWRRICRSFDVLEGLRMEGLRMIEKVPNLTVIGNALERGDGVPGAVLAERGQHVEIK